MRGLRPGDNGDRGRSVRRPDRGAGIAAAGARRPSGRISGPNENRRRRLAHGKRDAAQLPARRPVALARRAIAGNDGGRADWRRTAIGDRRAGEARGKRPRRPDKSKINGFDPRLDRVSAVERMGDGRINGDDDRPIRGVAIMNRHIPQGSQTMGGGQKNTRAQHQGRAKAGLVAAPDQHHRHPVGEAAVGLGADECARRSERQGQRRGKRQRLKEAGERRRH